MRNIILLLTILLAQHAYGQEQVKVVDTKVTSKGARYNITAQNKEPLGHTQVRRQTGPDPPFFIYKAPILV